ADVEVGARAVGLDDLRQAQLHRFVGSEALLAAEAPASAAYRITRLRDTRVDHLRFGAAAERAFHFRESGVRGQESAPFEFPTPAHLARFTLLHTEHRRRSDAPSRESPSTDPWSLFPDH